MRTADALLHLGLLEDEALRLDQAALELAALDHPAADLASCDRLIGEISALAGKVSAHTAEDRASALAGIIAGKFGFTGDRESYDDPRNADLIAVLARRRGLPVSLAILYIAVARRVGWSADALNTPGHVLVQIGSDTAPVLIDPFNYGRRIEREQLGDLLSQILGRVTIPTSEHLAPMSNRAILVRLLMNQATRAEAGGDSRRALLLYERMTIVSPASVHSWWERARLERAAGDGPAARRSLAAMLEMVRDPGLRNHVSATLDALADKM